MLRIEPCANLKKELACEVNFRFKLFLQKICKHVMIVNDCRSASIKYKMIILKIDEKLKQDSRDIQCVYNYLNGWIKKHQFAVYPLVDCDSLYTINECTKDLLGTLICNGVEYKVVPVSFNIDSYEIHFVILDEKALEFKPVSFTPSLVSTKQYEQKEDILEKVCMIIENSTSIPREIINDYNNMVLGNLANTEYLIDIYVYDNKTREFFNCWYDAMASGGYSHFLNIPYSYNNHSANIIINGIAYNVIPYGYDMNTMTLKGYKIGKITTAFKENEIRKVVLFDAYNHSAQLVHDIKTQLEIPHFIELIKTGSLLCEYGHPLDMTDLNRYATIDPRYACAQIMSYQWEDNLLIGKVCFLKTPMGIAVVKEKNIKFEPRLCTFENGTHRLITFDVTNSK